MRAPVAGSSSTNIHMLGVTTPAIGPTARAVVAGLERDVAPASNSGDRVLRVVDQALERGAAHQRAAQRPGGAVPGDRRPGVQELARLQPEHLGRRARRRPARRLHGRASRRAPRALASRRSGSAATVARSSSVPAHRRPPVDPGDVDGLVGDGVGEQVGADGHRRRSGWSIARSSRRLPGARSVERAAGRRAALDRCTSAPAVGQRARPGASRPCGSPSVPTTRRPPRGRSAPRRSPDRRRERAAGSGSAPWPSTTSSSTTRGRPGRRPPRPAARGAASGRSSGAARPAVYASSPKSTMVWPAPSAWPPGRGRARARAERDVAAHRAEHLGGDQHGLVAQRAADEQPAQRGPGRARRRAAPRTGQAGTVAPEPRPAPPRRRRSGRAGPAPSSASSTGRAERRGVRSGARRRPRRPAAWRPPRRARRPGRRRARRSALAGRRGRRPRRTGRGRRRRAPW